MLQYYGILFPNNSASLRPINHSVLQLIILLYLPSPRISFTLNSKHSSLINLFLLSLFAPSLSVLWPNDLANGFHLIVIFTLSFILTSFIYASVCEKASISFSSLAGFENRHSKSPHSFFILSLHPCEVIIIIIIVILPTQHIRVTNFV